MYNYTIGILTGLGAVIIVCLCIAVRIVYLSCKLPIPFKIFLQWLLYINIAITIFYIIDLNAPHVYNLYFYHVTYYCKMMQHGSVTFLCIDRLVAVRHSLFYIRWNSDEYVKKVNFIQMASLIFHLILYVCSGIVSSFVGTGVVDTSRLRRHCWMTYFVTVTIHDVIVMISLILVAQAILVKRSQHTRRITRMGLPNSQYISSHQTTHVSMAVFMIAPSTILLSTVTNTITYVLDPQQTIWIPYIPDFITIIIHCLVPMFWFDEGRFLLMKMMSIFNRRIRKRTEDMRVHVYNIVLPDSSQLEQIQSRKRTIVTVQPY